MNLLGEGPLLSTLVVTSVLELVLSGNRIRKSQLRNLSELFHRANVPVPVEEMYLTSFGTQIPIAFYFMSIIEPTKGLRFRRQDTRLNCTLLVAFKM